MKQRIETDGRGGPADRYAADLAAGRILADPAQARAIEELERIYAEIAGTPERVRAGFFSRLINPGPTPWVSVHGLYLWGPVGRGKTYLVDTFYECLPHGQASRIHFHSFMRRTHHALRGLRDQRDPLRLAAADWAASIRVLCLDEFHVGDITDAMLLAGLLEALLEHGVTIIATSNEAPDELYAGGLQRERFLPAIALIKARLAVHELAGEQDYRLRVLEQAPVYYVDEPGASRAVLEARFEAVSPGTSLEDSLVVEGRVLDNVRRGDGIVWFTFEQLCGGPRSTGDYIELARCHHTIVLEDVPVLERENDDAARRFINFVDEVYDRRVNLLLSAAAEPEALYSGDRLAKPFLRTASRLREMRSHEYLAEPHISD